LNRILTHIFVEFSFLEFNDAAELKEGWKGRFCWELFENEGARKLV